MAKAYASTVISAPADKVWALIRDFNSLADWFPVVADSMIEDGKSGDQIGAVRNFHLQDGAHLRERLLSHSDTNRSYSYNFELTPWDVQNYHATIRVTPVTDSNSIHAARESTSLMIAAVAGPFWTLPNLLR